MSSEAIDSVSGPEIASREPGLFQRRETKPTPSESEALELRSVVSQENRNDLEANQSDEPEFDEGHFKDFPEGGLEAWLVVFGSWCAMTATFGITNTTGFLQAYLAENQLKDYSESDISWIFSVYLFLFFFGGVQVGPIFDTYGLRFVLIPGCVGTIITFFILSVCKEYYQFILCFSILGGISASLVFTPSIATIGHWFYKKRGLATGIAATGGALGGIVYPLALNKMISEIGYGWSIRVIAFIITLLCGGTILTLKTRFPDVDVEPSEPDGKRHKKVKGQNATIDIKAFKEPLFLLTACGTFLIELALFIPLTYITSYALKEGVDYNFSYQILAILNAFSVFGRGLPGYVADIWGRFNVMIITACICAISILAIWLPAGKNVGAMIGFSAMFGFWSGTGICLTPVCISQICKTSDYGKKYGTTYFFVSFGTLIGLPIAGALLNSSGGYRNLIIFSACVYLAGALCFSCARVMAAGWSLKVVY